MTSPQPRRRDRGVALITTSMVLVPLMIFAAFGVDLASWYSRLTDLQRAADAAALAGAVWMPQMGPATADATDSLASNGIVHGEDGMQVQIQQGSRPTALRVTVTDTDAQRYFSQIVQSGPQSLSRSAEAEYNLPLPLGSPLNYFGGDASRVQPTTVISHSVTWPTDYTTRRPLTVPCNVGTAAAQGLGRWNSSGSFEPTGFNSANPICAWAVSGQNSSGASAVPPPDYTTRPPTNATDCRVAQSGTGPTILGRWQGGAFNTGTTGSAPACTWPALSTVLSTVRPNYNSVPPTGQPCRVGYEASLGWWNANVFSTSGVPTGVAASSGNRLCTWSASISSVDSTPPNPIDSTRSPGFWAQVHGPGADQQSGDAYSTRCTTTTNCGTPNNSLYVGPSDPNQGYWYIVKIPSGGGGPTTIRVFDAQLTPGNLNVGTGDSAIAGAGMSFTTTYQVYRQTNPLDFNSRTPMWTGGPNQGDDSCNWAIDQQSGFRFVWRNLCSFSATAGQTYLINVRTDAAANSAGRNGYALEACRSTSCTVGVQPALNAYERMVLYNNVENSEATFYIAEVAPQYAGKTLVLELFDPGESSGQAWVYPMMPSASAPRPVVNVPPSNCSITSSRSGYPRAPSDLHLGGACSFRSTDGSALYNSHWVTMRINIPPTYTCTPGVDPEVSSNSCWWGVRYDFDGAATDTTTWRARIEGNPLQLTE